MIRQTHSAGRPSQRPPIFFGCIVRGLLVLWLATLPALALAGPAPAAATKPGSAGYRLAGVMLVGNDRIGFLEVPAGGQVLVRVGTTIDGGKVTVFNEHEMRIVFPTRTVVLELDAGDGQAANPAPTGVVTSQEDNGNIMVRQVDTDQMIAVLETMKQAPAPAPGKATRPDANAELGRRFAAVAHLPPNARIVAVNEEPVDSAAKAIADVEKSLSEGQSVTLTLAARPGEPAGRVYINTQRD